MPPSFFPTLHARLRIVLMALAAVAVVPIGAQTAAESSVLSGPVRLNASPAAVNTLNQQALSQARDQKDEDRRNGYELATPYVQGEFEQFVQRMAGDEVPIRRLGSELVTGSPDARGAELSTLVPQDYIVSPGDEVQVNLWGSVEADLRLVVDQAGRITIPRVGPVQVAGVRHADLQEAVSRRISSVFRNFHVSVSLGQLRGIRIFVSGFVARPGVHPVSSLSTVVTALMRAGGPTSAGSFRNIELRRGAKLIASIDLYDLLLNGDRSADLIVQAGDVVHVGPVGAQVGVIGSVNRPAVIELRPGETVVDALRMVGQFNAVADRSRLAIERLRDRNGARIVQLNLPEGLNQALNNGDVIRAFSAVKSTLATRSQSKRIRIEGEVQRPADYVLPPGSTIGDALRAAGGLTPSAFLYATEFTRDSVRAQQQENHDRALRDLETELARTAASTHVGSADEASAQALKATSNSRLVERLRNIKPSGRIVLQLTPNSDTLPDLPLEDGDRLYVPPKPSTIGVFGSVFNPANYLLQGDRTIGEYLKLAGGPTKTADGASAFIVRADGSVISERQAPTGWFRNSALLNTKAEPGDMLYIPEEIDRVTLVQGAKDWTQVLYQFGLGIAGVKALGL